MGGDLSARVATYQFRAADDYVVDCGGGCDGLRRAVQMRDAGDGFIERNGRHTIAAVGIDGSWWASPLASDAERKHGELFETFADPLAARSEPRYRIVGADAPVIETGRGADGLRTAFWRAEANGVGAVERVVGSSIVRIGAFQERIGWWFTRHASSLERQAVVETKITIVRANDARDDILAAHEAARSAPAHDDAALAVLDWLDGVSRAALLAIVMLVAMTTLYHDVFFDLADNLFSS